MKTPVNQGLPTGRGPKQIVLSSNGFTVEVCRHQESFYNAFHLRYQAYLQAGSIPPNPQELLSDDFDPSPHTWTHLVWHEGQPVATIRSCIYSDVYEWQTTEARSYFAEDIERSLGTNVGFLESNRFAVSPHFQGRKSMFAQLLLFQMHALNSALHGVSHILTSVRDHHVPFYRRFLGMEEISTTRQFIPWVDAEVALMATTRDRCFEVAIQKGMPDYSDEDLRRYMYCAGIALA
ncbi:MAG: GNAT family N-acyltransferase [Saprospiraceae bacterium]|nr:GNAT family N-acetyltransferase [Lewinella sp.]